MYSQANCPGKVRERLISDLHEKCKDDGEFFSSSETKILLADDDPMSNYALRGMIERSGKFQVIPCYNGLEVKHLIK